MTGPNAKTEAKPIGCSVGDHDRFPVSVIAAERTSGFASGVPERDIDSEG